jgi:HNH endonuclease
MLNIQEVFTGSFSGLNHAVVQRCDDKTANLKALKQGYTEHWDVLPAACDLIVLAIGDKQHREIWAGKLKDQQPSMNFKGSFKYRFLVEKFELLGVHDKAEVSDADFYNNGGGGGSRVLVSRKGLRNSANSIPSAQNVEVGEMILRSVWLRKNHAKFRDPVHMHWDKKCAVTQENCNGLLIASHIKPWSVSTPEEKTDVNNGLLLAAPLDTLFDGGLISFSDTGLLIASIRLDSKTAKIFGIKNRMQLKEDKLTSGMKKYLKWHRNNYHFQ